MAISSPLFVIAFLSGAVSLVFGLLVVYRWHKPGADWYAVSIVGAVCWSFGYAGGLLVFDPSLRWLFEVPIWIGHGVVPVAFFVFVLRYTGRIDSLSPSHHVLLWTIPVVTMLVVLTNDVHNLMWSGYRIVPTADAATVLYEKGPWLYVHKAYSYVIVAAASVIIFQLFAARDSLYTTQAAALVAAMAPLMAASVAWVFGLGPYPQLSGTPLLFGLLYAVTALVLFETTVFDSAPAARRIGKRRVIDDFDDGVLLLDDTDRIVDANAAAEDALETEHDLLVGSAVDDVFPETVPDVSPGQFTIRLETTVGYRIYEVTISPISDGRAEVLGHSLVFHDVTEETQRRQRLSVLNRVLRHNLRNDLNVIQAYATELEESVAAPHDELASVVVEQATGLAALGEKARRLERTLDGPDGALVTLSVTSVISSIVATHDDDASFSVTVDGSGNSHGDGHDDDGDSESADIDDRDGDGDDCELEITTYPTLFRAVLEDAIENAVVHGGEYPTVTVDARRCAGGVELTITDDGPGLSEFEYIPLDAGVETPLEHGSGLGLWLVFWGVSHLGGSVSFTRPDTGGTRVHVRLPRTPRE